MQTRLFLFEGQPGTGKSTLSQNAATWLRQNGLTVHWLGESPLYRKQFQPFWKALQARDARLGDILLEAWHQVAHEIACSKDIFILEGALSNLSVNLLLAADLSRADIESSVAELFASVERFDPAIVYLHGDVRAILERTAQARGEQWVQAVSELFSGFPYQQVRGWTGLSGLEAFLQEAQAVMDEVIFQRTHELLAIEVTGAVWQDYGRQVEEFLGQRVPGIRVV